MGTFDTSALWEYRSEREAYYLKTVFKGTFDTSVGDRSEREAYSGVLPTLVLDHQPLDALEDETQGVESHGEGEGSGEEVEGKAVRRYVSNLFSIQKVCVQSVLRIFCTEKVCVLYREHILYREHFLYRARSL